MLLLLQARSPRPARELAAALEVSDRTVYRDVDALSASGIPIFATRGAQGGIHLVDGYRRAIAELDEDEIHALYVSGSDPLADLGFGTPLQRAREKLSSALSERQKSIAEKTRARIRVEQRRWGQDDVPVEMLATVRRAVWDDRRLSIAYRDRQGARTARTIDPLGLVSKSGVWYVIARDGSEYRSFRADRIAGAELLPDRFERPADFDLDEYWSQSTRAYEQTIPRYGVVLRVAPDALDRVTAYWRPVSVERSSDEHDIVRIDFPAREMAVHQIVAWGELVTVLEPAEILPEMVALARSVLERYERATPLPA
ncbi:MAG: YafY family transcriptional regulator [Candidatus Eremiobacteraeota bacterium]|nr:YafY family transcriptional regulator [Candidatus Eremiobacteraeota bacterium]MBV8355874.1 YafY family transcriptional regulator [Candidatus Eremiobacteraeota bacterium]